MKLPPGFPPALIEAGRLRREGRLPDAVVVLDAALAEARGAPLESPFQARVQLGLALADLHLTLNDADRAKSLLANEVAFADQTVQAIRRSGAPDQLRAASAGRFQLKDRATQVGLLGEPAPALDIVEWALGAPTTLAEQRGYVVLLEFWATWCRPCLDMFPRLLDLHARYAERGLTVLAVTHVGAPPGEDQAAFQAPERESIHQVVADRGITFGVGIAPDERT